MNCSPLVSSAIIQHVRQCQKVRFVMFCEISLQCVLAASFPFQANNFTLVPLSMKYTEISLPPVQARFSVSLFFTDSLHPLLIHVPSLTLFLSYLTTRICILNAVVEWIWAQKGGRCMEVKGLCCRIVRCDLDKHSCCSGRLGTMPSFKSCLSRALLNIFGYAVWLIFFLAWIFLFLGGIIYF
jgi:hypothetical protein